MYPPAAKLNEEQHTEAAEPEGLNGEEITGEHRLGVRAQELTPAEPSARASGRHGRPPKDLGDRCRGNPHADTRQLADDPLITPARVLTRKPQHQLTSRVRDRRSAWRPAFVRPPSPYQLAMPAK